MRGNPMRGDPGRGDPMTASICTVACCLSCCACHVVLVMLLCSCLLGVLLCLSVVLVVLALLCLSCVLLCLSCVCVCVCLRMPRLGVLSSRVLCCRVECRVSCQHVCRFLLWQVKRERLDRVLSPNSHTPDPALRLVSDPPRFHCRRTTACAFPAWCTSPSLPTTV